MHFILIIFMATSSSNQAGAGTVAIEFNNERACKEAGASLVSEAHTRGNYTLTWGCYEKGSD